MTHSKDIPGLIEWLRKRAEPNSGIRYESRSIYGQPWVELFGTDATFVAEHFHGQGAAKLADCLAALRPAADPKAEGVLTVSDEQFEELKSALSQPAVPTQSIRDGAELIKELYPVPPTPDAERAGEPVGYVAGMGMTLLKEGYSATIWPMTAAGDLADDTEHPLYAQSPATEAVSEALTNIDYLIDDVVADAYVHGAEGRSTEVSPHSAKTLHDAIAALIRPPVNNSPEPEHIVADVSKAAADTEAQS